MSMYPISIEWNDSMSTGIPEIDADHKRFVSLINSFSPYAVPQMDSETAMQLLQLISEDARRHFAYEESRFREWQYPDSDGHAARHAEIIGMLAQMKSRLAARKSAPEWVELALSLKNILLTHILIDDMKYADFYHSIRNDRDSPD